MIVNVTVTQHHRQPSTQISHKPIVLRYMVLGRFGWFSWWLYSIVQTIFRAKFQGNITQYFRRRTKKNRSFQNSQTQTFAWQQINVKRNETTN